MFPYFYLSFFGPEEVPYDPNYKTKELKEKIIKEKNFDQIEIENPGIKEEIQEKTKDKKLKIYTNSKDNNIKCIYIFEEEKESKTNNLRLIKKVYINDLAENEKEEYAKAMIDNAIKLVAKAKYKEVIIPQTILEFEKEDITVKTNSKHPKLDLLIFKIKVFLIIFVLASIIDDLFSGLIWGLIGFITLGSPGDIITEGYVIYPEEESTNDNNNSERQ